MSAVERRATIDIGSNTIRLVVFGGPPRVPLALYNEKLTPALGKAVVETGLLADDAMDAALRGLARFKVLVDAMQLSELHVVATAAVREAGNGPAFLDRIRALGLPVRLLTGEEEAMASGLGVLSAIPDADGIVADLGGGSLELVRVAHGSVCERTSLPLGILRVQSLLRQADTALQDEVRRAVAQTGWASDARNLPLYLVGGSWRALARVHMHLYRFPLRVLGNHVIPVEALDEFARMVSAMDRDALRAIPNLPGARLPYVADAIALLRAVSDALGSSRLVTCAFGLREGLLHAELDEQTRAQDPLLESVRFATAGQQQFPGYDAALMRWLDGLFGEEPPSLRRLRHAVCLLRGTGWASNPDFRAMSGEEVALHGNWAGVDGRERAMMGMALFVGLGGSGDDPSILAELADAPSLARARFWGQALRVAQRLSGGAPSILDRSSLSRQGDRLELALQPEVASLDDATLRRRLERLAGAMGCSGSDIVARAA